MPAASGPSVKCQQRLKSPSRHEPHGGSIPRGRTRQPRVQNDPLADLQLRDSRAQFRHLGDHFVPQDGRSREIAVEGAVGEVVAEIHEDLLGIRAADTREARLGHHPTISGGVRLLTLLQPHGRLGQPNQQVIPVIGWRPRLRPDAVRESLHCLPSVLERLERRRRGSVDSRVEDGQHYDRQDEQCDDATKPKMMPSTQGRRNRNGITPDACAHQGSNDQPIGARRRSLRGPLPGTKRRLHLCGRARPCLGRVPLPV